MSLRPLLAAFLVLFLVINHSAAVAAAPAPADESFFPIMPYNHVPSDPAVLKQMADCGLTVAGFAYAKDLDAIHAAGMKAIINDPRAGGYDWTNVDAAKARENVT